MQIYIESQKFELREGFFLLVNFRIDIYRIEIN